MPAVFDLHWTLAEISPKTIKSPPLVTYPLLIIHQGEANE